jgi:tetratricopeptide (TPR) repeat protein
MNAAPVGPTLSVAAKAKDPAADDGALSADRPFPGLRPFTFADRAYFFGRERQIYALYRLLESGRFIAVIGSSGSGKSSLVLAGLLGLLSEEAAEPHGPNWVCRDMRPGSRPLSRLASTLACLAENGDADGAARRRDRIDWRLRQSSFSFEAALEEAGGLRGRSLLLVVDQFEELFRFGLAGVGPRRLALDETRAREEATQFVQILLDADRRRLENVRVLITMRSDFIGDCAFFRGLSEAVSLTQYLVPNLTHSQLEDVIRKPIEEAGATIEPELVERLINDSGDGLDQLPVLQHCLMRLWDCAGDAANARARQPEPKPRRLTRDTYRDIGGIAEALSRHADQILGDCVGDQKLAAEQAFRALSELDREGRAIRRALPFDQLLAEAGVSEKDLRAVLDRFRAPSCSFLVPPTSASPMLAVEDRLDIGHEALLRRWRTLAGDSALLSSPAAKGWLAEEDEDGRHYRLLVSMLGEDGQDSGTLPKPEETDRWWAERPRTRAWANRYGGRLEDVRKLIDENIAAKRQLREAQRRSKRNRILLASLGVAGVLAALAWGVVLRQEEIDKSAMRSAKTLLEKVLEAYNDKSLDPAGAASLAAISGQFLDEARKASETSAADLLWGQALDVEVDLKANLGRNSEALDLARRAKSVGLSLTASNPRAQDSLQLLYDSTIRVGNALAGMGDARDLEALKREALKREALNEYDEAVGVAGKIDDKTGAGYLIDGHMKIGDIHQDLKQFPEALAEYKSGLSTCEAALSKDPQSSNLLRNEGKAFFRIAEFLRTQKSLDEARTFFRKALEVQDALVARNAQEALAGQKKLDPSLKSNLSETYTQWALLEKKAGNLHLALAKLQRGIALDEELRASQPSSLKWLYDLAPNYRLAAEILEHSPDQALDYYRKLFDARRNLAFPSQRDPESLEKFAEAAKLVGDHSSGVPRFEAYRAAVSTWGRLIDDPKVYSSATTHFDDVEGFARVFAKAGDWLDAQTAYRVAMKIAVLNYVENPSDTPWRDKAEAAERALVATEKPAETAPADPRH